MNNRHAYVTSEWVVLKAPRSRRPFVAYKTNVTKQYKVETDNVGTEKKRID